MKLYLIKRWIALGLAIITALLIALPALAAPKVPEPEPEVGARETVILEKNPFHCNTFGGNGRAYAQLFEDRCAADKALKKGGIGGVMEDIIYLSDNSWMLANTTDYVCSVCGKTVWVSFSNKSGVPDGKNMQFTHGNVPSEEPATEVSSLSVLKTVDGVPILEWAINNGIIRAGEALPASITQGMRFTAHLLDEEMNPGVGVAGQMNPLTGIIDFGGSLPIGWYQVVEEISGTSMNYFVGGNHSQIYYVGKDGVSGERTHFISGQEGVGAVVSHSGEGVNWPLPEVWNNTLAGQPAFERLREMGAQWVWDTENTYIHGIGGSQIEIPFTVTLGEAREVPIYFAADNVALIYVNGRLAAKTEVALAGREPPENYQANALGDFRFDKFDGRWTEGWNYSYEETISLNAGVNEIIIVAANSSSAGTLENGIFIPGTTGTDNDGYNLTNNPCGVIFGFEVPAVTFNNTAKAELHSQTHVVPMVSEAVRGYINTEEFWGLPLWDASLGSATNFTAPGAYENGQFISGSELDRTAEYIWDKPLIKCTEAEPYGEQIAKFTFTYDFKEGVDKDSVEFTDFNIAADNAFALYVNGKLVHISNDFQRIVGEPIFELGYLKSFHEEFMTLNQGPDYDWQQIYTITAAKMLEAWNKSDTVEITILAYNVPEFCAPHGTMDSFYNPAMMIFSGSFKYDTVTLVPQ